MQDEDRRHGGAPKDTHGIGTGIRDGVAWDLERLAIAILLAIIGTAAAVARPILWLMDRISPMQPEGRNNDYKEEARVPAARPAGERTGRAEEADGKQDGRTATRKRRADNATNQPADRRSRDEAGRTEAHDDRRATGSPRRGHRRLKAETVRRIRRAFDGTEATTAALADHHGVTRRTIREVAHRRRWTGLPAQPDEWEPPGRPAGKETADE